VTWKEYKFATVQSRKHTKQFYVLHTNPNLVKKSSPLSLQSIWSSYNTYRCWIQ